MSPRKGSRTGSFAGLRLRPAPKGREVRSDAHAEILRLLGDRPRRADLLIEHLHLIQDAHGHISADHLTALAYEMDLTPAEVYEVASFYHHFDVIREGETAPPAVTVRVCESISCHLAGAEALLEGVRGRTGEDVRVLRAPCVGRCAHAPVAVVGRDPVDHATPDDVADAVRDLRTEPAIPDYTSYADYRAHGGYDALIACVNGDRTVDDVIANVDASGLRGLGGAGFPTARKWKFVRAEPKPRIVALNADEGEPGTFKDRVCMESDPHRGELAQ
jgi:formate dehydrogenase